MENLYYKSLLIFFLSIGFLTFTTFFLYERYKKKRLATLKQLPFIKEYKDILQNIPFYTKLNSKDKEKIHKDILVFIHTKEFVGIGIDVNLEIQIVIAFYACLLLLHINISESYENLATIVIYPHTIVASQVSNNGGIFTKGEFLLEGQSASDTVVLSWDEVKKDAYHSRNDNVVIHEFAHEIDFLDGRADGIPPMSRTKYYEWAYVLYDEFQKLQKITLNDRDLGKYKLLGSYAATNEAEFFAVVTERYYEKPETLKKYFPKLYNELESFYKAYKE